MLKSVKSVVKSHMFMVSVAILVTSVLSLILTTQRETFFAGEAAATSVIGPEYDFNKRLEALTSKGQANARDTLLDALAREHIPMIMCAFYDIVTGPRRAQQPSNMSEGAWIQKIWADLMTDMGIAPEVYVSILQLRYSWFTETKDSFDTFQTKLEPNFVKATLENYIKKTGNFAPTSVDAYNKAMNCKLYRQFNKAANLTYYMAQRQPSQATPASPSVPSTSSQTAPAIPATPTSHTTPTTQAVPTTSSPTITSSTTSSTVSPLPIKWNIPPNFLSLCLENRLFCTMFVLVIIIAFIAIAAFVISFIAPILTLDFWLGKQSSPTYT